MFIIPSRFISSRKPKGHPDPRWKPIPWWNEVNNFPLTLYLEAQASTVAKEKSIWLSFERCLPGYSTNLFPIKVKGFKFLSKGQTCFKAMSAVSAIAQISTFTNQQKQKSLFSKWLWATFGVCFWFQSQVLFFVSTAERMHLKYLSLLLLSGLVSFYF